MTITNILEFIDLAVITKCEYKTEVDVDRLNYIIRDGDMGKYTFTGKFVQTRPGHVQYKPRTEN